MIWHASIRADRRRGVVRVCMVSTFSRVWINQEKNLARCQLKRGKLSFPFPCSRLRIWSRDTGSAVPFNASLLILHAQAESGADLRYSSRFPRRRPHIYTPSTAIGSVPNLMGRAIAYRWRPLPRVYWHRACSPQGSSSNGCCHFRFHPGANVRCASLLRHPLLVCSTADMCDIESIGGG